jgi:osmotically-inducible protein OsmY
MKVKRAMMVGVLGAAGAYFFDSNSGARRRHEARDRVAAFFRGRKREAERRASYAQGVAQGVQHKVAATAGRADGKHNERQAEELNDPALADKVKSEIFRDPDAPKGDVNVNVEEGVVYLRGELERPDQIEELVASARKVDGVREVENLLHTPGTPAPTK